MKSPKAGAVAAGLAGTLLLIAGAVAFHFWQRAAEARGRADRIETEYHAARAGADSLREAAAAADSARRAELRALAEEAAREVGIMRGAAESAEGQLARLRTRVPRALVPLVDSAAASCRAILGSCRDALAAKDSAAAILRAQRDQERRLNAAAFGALALADTTIGAKNEALHASGGFHIAAPLASGIVGLALGLALGAVLRP